MLGTGFFNIERICIFRKISVGMLGSGLKGSLGSVGWPRQRLVGCPCSFGSLELVFIIFLGVGCLWESTISLSPTRIVFGVCFTGFGEGPVQGDVEQKHSMWLSLQLSRSVGAEYRPLENQWLLQLPSCRLEGVPTVNAGSPLVFLLPSFHLSGAPQLTQRFRPTSRDSAAVD